MIHGIYVRTRPKNKWHLVSISLSLEETKIYIDEALKQAQLEGNDEAEVAYQIFDSAFWIPHYLSEVKEQKAMYN
jgi:hypothetical protein